MPLFYGAMRMLFPHKIDPARSEWSTEDLKATYKGREYLYNLCTCGFAVVSVMLVYNILSRISNSVVPVHAEDRFFLRPDRNALLLPGIFLGIGLATLPSTALIRLLLWNRYAEYQEYCNRKYRFNTTKVGALVLIPISICAIALAVLIIDSWGRITDRGFTINEFSSLGAVTHPFGDITSIKRVLRFKAPNGKILNRPYHVVQFSDGNNWSTQDTLCSAAPDQSEALKQRANDEIILFLSARAKKAVQTVDLL